MQGREILHIEYRVLTERKRYMAISAIANAGTQPPTLASLLQINRINPLTGRESDDSAGVSGVALPKAGPKKPAAPKLIQDLLQTLNQMGANEGASKSAKNSSEAQDIKKSAMDFLASVFSALKPQSNDSELASASSIESLSAGLSQMIGEISSGSPSQSQVIQSADMLLQSSGVASNTSNLSALLQGLQRSIMDDAGAGTLINTKA
jgi:hypothetical protein